MDQQTQTQEKKPLVARSTAQYRGLFIMETDEGCTFFIGHRRYDCLDLAEAKAAIDAIYSRVIITQ